MINYMANEVRGDIAYSFPNLNLDAGEWIRHFILHIIMDAIIELLLD